MAPRRRADGVSHGPPTCVETAPGATSSPDFLGVWGPISGPKSPFWALSARYDKTGSPYPLRTSGQYPARDSNPEPTD